ncbi:MAG: sigma D regulator [Porticoccaceae bacterium]|nr:sigma D regulator [Porticoccaceae bacterium]
MEDKNLQPNEFWPWVHDRIKHWLEARRNLLVTFCELSNVKDFDDKNLHQGRLLQTFCQQLVDYISEGHFEIFEQLINEGHLFNDSEALASGKKLLPAIYSLTDVILDFNDKYLATDDLSSLTIDLSKLGENLAQRFEIEDSMVNTLHSEHYQQILIPKKPAN